MSQQPQSSTRHRRSSDRSAWPHLGSSSSLGSIAQAAIEQDIKDTQDTAQEDVGVDFGQEADGLLLPTNSRQDASDQRHSLVGSYHHPTYLGGVNRPPFSASTSFPQRKYFTEQEQTEALIQERELLRDNQLIPPERPLTRRGSSRSSATPRRTSEHKYSAIPSMKGKDQALDEQSQLIEASNPDETSALLGRSPSRANGSSDEQSLDRKWEEAITEGKIQTSWQRESKVLFRFSRPLIVTFILQWSLTQASVFTVGHIGKKELAAVSLGSMTASITGYAIYQGLATSLDTLCAQAYGSGHKHLVGLQMQRMVIFLWTITIPISIVWASGTQILKAIIPDKEVAELAGLYLKILIAGAPGYAAFESGKRFCQAQGLFSANMYCLLLCAPLNALLHYLFVWRLHLGFIGAPLAVVITETLLPLTLLTYVRFIAGRACWGGLSPRAALRNWGPMIRLAVPGLAMVLAEFLAFEILTLCAGLLGTEALAAQAVVGSVATLTFFVMPFPVSIAASTRLANLIGAGLGREARTCAVVVMVAAAGIGLANMVLVSAARRSLPMLFTNDAGVLERAAKVLPVCAAFQLFDSLAANCNGVLRGLGRQAIGGYVNVGSYYAVAIPISIATCFGLHWDMYGLWIGPAIGLALVAGIEGWVIFRTSWEGAVEAARKRNAQG
ncbi:MAG: hypothetical protein Q9165_005533 [Trypethelium subeluteriae]